MKSKRENSKSLMLKKEDKNMTKIIKKKKNNLKVPNLRFPEFEGEWEIKKLGEVCEIKTGNKDTQNKIDDGKYPFLSVQTL
ncbi:type I restriction enzyme, S subunit [Myroides phaeus]|uniref:Type I restriction enzyme, S subunit n=1 Tax=Myroides phaeus TaxID=702745 RepID=A0A1G8DLD8_9FLAO|nr:type I restriction enzyme, S subunit [Myroides phaeus]